MVRKLSATRSSDAGTTHMAVLDLRVCRYPLLAVGDAGAEGGELGMLRVVVTYFLDVGSFDSDPPIETSPPTPITMFVV